MDLFFGLHIEKEIARNVNIENGLQNLHFWYSSWFFAWLFINHAPTYATVERRFTYQALRVVLEPISKTGNNVVLRFFGHLIFAQAARSIGS